MAIRKWLDLSQPLPGAPGARCVEVAADEWREVALDVAAGRARLQALWTECTEGVAARAVYTGDDFLLLATLPWSIGLVRLPWMARPLTVEWATP